MWKWIVDIWNCIIEIDTDWPMVIITTIYVVATVRILRANRKSADAAREQLAITKEQYEEAKRLEFMPMLQMQFSHNENDLHEVEHIDIYPSEAEDPSTISQFFDVKNIGNGTAANITFTWKFTTLDFFGTDYLPISGIMHGDSCKLILSCDIDSRLIEESTLSLEFEYYDLIGNGYEQRIFLRIKDGEFVRCENDLPKYLGDKTYVFENREVHHE